MGRFGDGMTVGDYHVHRESDPGGPFDLNDSTADNLAIVGKAATAD